MWRYLALGVPLLFLAAIWPPYNVFLAYFFSKKDFKTALGIILSSSVGLSLSVVLIFLGGRFANLPLNFIGAAIVGFLGVKMLFNQPVNTKFEVVSRMEAISSTFFLSFIPGVFAFTAASGLYRGEIGQLITVFLAGPVLGISLGGLLLYLGVSLFKLPLNKIGGLLLIAIAIYMLF